MEPIHLAGVLHDPDLDWPAKRDRIVHLLRQHPWVRSAPEYELIHGHIEDFERAGGEIHAMTALGAILDEAAYHRVQVITHVIV